MIACAPENPRKMGTVIEVVYVPDLTNGERANGTGGAIQGWIWASRSNRAVWGDVVDDGLILETSLTSGLTA